MLSASEQSILLNVNLHGWILGCNQGEEVWRKFKQTEVLAALLWYNSKLDSWLVLC